MRHSPPNAIVDWMSTAQRPLQSGDAESSEYDKCSATYTCMQSEKYNNRTNERYNSCCLVRLDSVHDEDFGGWGYDRC